MQQAKLTKKQKRAMKLQGVIIDNGLKLNEITPKTFNQARAFRDYQQKQSNLFMHGTAGTGKTFIALYLALNDLANQNAKRVIVVRSAVPVRDQGFLPGNPNEKAAVYENPYISNVNELYGRGDAYSILVQKKQLEFITTSYLRGITLRDSIIIIDEIQNMTWQEINTVMTRIGNGCRVIVCGDTKQPDLDPKRGKGDVVKFIDVCQNMSSFSFIQMTVADIVRGGMVREFIVESEKLGY